MPRTFEVAVDPEIEEGIVKHEVLKVVNRIMQVNGLDAEKIDREHLEDFIMQTIQEIFPNDVKRMILQRAKIPTIEPLRRAHAIQYVDAFRAENLALKVDFPWNDPNWQGRILKEYLRPASEKLKLG